MKKDLQEEPNKAAADGLEDTEQSAKRRLVQNDAIASTSVYRGFRRTRRSDVIVDGKPATRHKLTNTSPHAEYLEFGTGGYFGTKPTFDLGLPSQRFEAPSFSVQLVAAIRRWMVLKPGFVIEGDGYDTAASIAYTIAFGAPRDPSDVDHPLPGTPPQPFMGPAWYINKLPTKGAIRKAVYEAVP